MTCIVTLTLNPAIDSACETDEVRPIHKVRTRNERYDPGGGGLNVSRVVNELGGETLAIYLGGGATGPLLESLVKAHGVPSKRIETAGNTRISHTVFETSSGQEYRFVPEGPLVSAAECATCLEELRANKCDWLVASGSLPRGAPDDLYQQIGEIARSGGAQFIVDTSGEALRRTVAAGVARLIKPSLGEFESLIGRKLADHGEQERAAAEIVSSGKVGIIALTLGHEGALLVDKDGPFRMPVMPVEVKSAVGAGDSFLAAMTWGLALGKPTREAFVYGVAAGTAAVLTPGTEMCKRSDVERLFGEAKAIAAQRGVRL
jgi:6-phosphofructokinase 2